MTTVVRATCPGCKHILNIPSDWLTQAVRCKNCGLVSQAKASAKASGFRPAAASRTPPPQSRKITPPAFVPPSIKPPPPDAVVAQPAATAAAKAYPPNVHASAACAPATASIPLAVAAVAEPVGNGSPFDALDAEGPVPSVAPARYRRHASGWWKGPAVALGVLVVAVAVAVLAWPHISGLFQVQGNTGATPEVKNPALVETTEPTGAPVRPKEPGGKTKDKGNSSRETSDQPRGAPEFPRRALVIDVQNYLYANPTHAGMPIPGARNIPNFLDALNRGLHIPMNEMALLSDGAPKGARPPMKPVIEKTLTGFLDSSRAQDRIMVFFIGHAVAINGAAYLAPIEGELDNADTLIPLKWVYDRMAKCKARQKVLVMDVNRFNPGRGLERPNGGPMDPKEDAALKAPPEGVQVWTACVAGQQSYELDDAPMGLFLDSLETAMAPTKGEKGLEGRIQRPDDPLPLDSLRDLVNASMKEELIPYKLEQQSRLAGAEPKDGAAFDRAEAPAPSVVAGGRADRRRSRGDSERPGRDRHASDQAVARGRQRPFRCVAAVPAGDDGQVRDRRRADGGPEKAAGRGAPGPGRDVGAEHGPAAADADGRGRQGA